MEAREAELRAERTARQEAREAAQHKAEEAAMAGKPVPAVPAKPDTTAIPVFSGDSIVNTIAGAVWHPLFDAVKTEMDRAIEAKVGTLPTTIIEVRRADGSSHKLPSTHHPLLPLLIQVCASRQADGRQPNVWITGPTASGKSHAAKQVAEALDLKFYVQGSMSQAFELLGFIDAGGRYHDTPFRKAFEHGGVILLDEIDGGANEAILAINGGTANGGCSFPDKYVTRHPDCVIIGAANTWGSGANAEFVGRARIDAAILSRFPVKLAWDYDTALEVRISGNESWAKRVQNARHRAGVHKIKHLIDPRHTQAGAALIASGMSPDAVASVTYLAGLKPEQIEQIEGRRY
jgi:cobaltochelatase CobS